MSFIPDTGVMHFPSLQPAVRQYVHLESSGARDGTGQNGWYYPVLFVNTFWQLRSHMMPVNSTVTTLPIYINVNHLANWKFGLVASVDEGVKQTARNAANGTYNFRRKCTVADDRQVNHHQEAGMVASLR
jgi:hypothetical protein